jgi:hypothetical protein
LQITICEVLGKVLNYLYVLVFPSLKSGNETIYFIRLLSGLNETV